MWNMSICLTKHYYSVINASVQSKIPLSYDVLVIWSSDYARKLIKPNQRLKVSSMNNMHSAFVYYFDLDANLEVYGFQFVHSRGSSAAIEKNLQF